MKIPPPYQITEEMHALIAKIEGYQFFLKTNLINDNLKIKIQRKSVLKSSLFSAKIEGNPLDENTFGAERSNEQLEVFNILDGYEYIQNNNIIFDRNLMLKLHEIVMTKISPDNGNYRTEQGAIFNEAGIAIYITPPPEKIAEYIDKLVDYVNQGEKHPLIAAFMAHLVFEKIHPFIDGNGRVGRLTIQAIFKTKNYYFPFCVPFEEYLENYKPDYYHHLENGFSKTNDYLIFMLQAFLSQLENLKNNIEIENSKKEQIYLPPRQEEILNIIRDHENVSFDFIKRRFIKIPERTLRYDLKKITDAGYVVKIGNTNKAIYRVK